MPNPVDTEIDRALEFHQQGKLHEAELIYRDVLKNHPDNADALHFLGVIAHQVSQHQDAVALIGRAVQLAGPRADMLNNLAEALRCQGQLDQSISTFRQALELEPAY